MDNSQALGPSPFHSGEQQVQERVGVRERMEAFGRRAIRDHMPDQHRDFYAKLPFVLLGTLDDQGRPWASLLPGRPGFMTTPDAQTLDIAAQPLFGDPLTQSLTPGGHVGLLGIEPATRRRNRMTGTIRSPREGGFTISVSQAFGNCPQYIQARDVELLPSIETPGQERAIDRLDRFDERTQDLIERSDTLFIATAYSQEGDTPALGADVSHRGGNPGFVRVEDNRTFVFPDFSGNLHFNTIGNIVVNPKAGFLFVDFDNGDVVYMTGSADIVWEGEEVVAFEGAERLIRFHADQVIRVVGSLPLRFTFGDYSTTLENTGSWAKADQAISAGRVRNAYVDMEVFDVAQESDLITSFYLRRVDGGTLAPHEPGQFLPIRVSVPGEDKPVARTYTLSDASNPNHYRLSIKREAGAAMVSNFFHDRMTPGARLNAMAPRGKFVLDRSSTRPVVLLSGGVGITPMIAMLNAIVDEGKPTGMIRRTHFIHGARNGQAHAFAGHVRQLADEHAAVNAHIRYSDPGAEDRLGKTHDSEGRVDIELLKTVLSLDDYDYYMCGPAAFMQALYDGLTELGVRSERIHYESFGPATVLTSAAQSDPAPARHDVSDTPVDVRFSSTGVVAEWSRDKGTLLDLAEEAGLAPAFSCRSGICGTCATRIKCGAVDYIEEPTAPHGDDEVLICCATPRNVTGDASCGENVGVVLEL